MSSEEYLPVVWNGTIRNEGDTSTFTIAGSRYDPSLKRYIMSESGVTNGYAYNEPSDYSSGLNRLIGETLRWEIGDANLASAPDWALNVGTVAVSAGLVFGRRAALGLLPAGTITYGMHALNMFSLGVNSYQLATSPSVRNGVNTLGDVANIGLSIGANFLAGRLKGAAYLGDIGINLTQGAFGLSDAYGNLQNREYSLAALNTVGAALGLAGAGIRAGQFHSEFEVVFDSSMRSVRLNIFGNLSDLNRLSVRSRSQASTEAYRLGYDQVFGNASNNVR